MNTYLFQPRNYVQTHYFKDLTSLKRFILELQNAIHYLKSETIKLIISLEYYEAIFYLPIYPSMEIYVYEVARSPPMISLEA